MMTPPSFAEIIVDGPDAQAFLHGQLAADVKAITPGHWGYACYCVPDGRVQALVMLAHNTTEQWRLLLPSDVCDGVLIRLQRYRLRARCSLSAADVAIASTEQASAASYHCAAFCWSMGSAVPSVLSAALWSQQIDLGIPWIVAATSEFFLPQMLALERLQGFSLRKGCFPGQEIVARTHYLGRSKRRLVRLSQVDGELSGAAGDELSTEHSQKLGIMVAAGAQGRALAVLSEVAVPGMRLTISNRDQKASFVIESDVSETIGDSTLNGGYGPPVGA